MTPAIPSSLPARASLPSLTCSHSPAKFCSTFRVDHTHPPISFHSPALRWESRKLGTTPTPQTRLVLRSQRASCRDTSLILRVGVRGGGCTRTGGRGWSNTHRVPRDMAESQAGPRAGSAQLRFSSGVVLRVKDQRPRGSGVGEMERSSFERKPRHQDISSDP